MFPYITTAARRPIDTRRVRSADLETISIRYRIGPQFPQRSRQLVDLGDYDIVSTASNSATPRPYRPHAVHFDPSKLQVWSTPIPVEGRNIARLSVSEAVFIFMNHNNDIQNVHRARCFCHKKKQRAS